MKHIKIFIAISLITILASCQKMNFFQVSPNNPTVADPSLELSNIEQSTFSGVLRETAFSGAGDVASTPSAAYRQLDYTESPNSDQYYAWQRGSFDYSDISQVIKMQQEALRTDKMNYYYIGKFFIDYYIVNMTEKFGDIPYSQMMQSISNNSFDSAATHPVYDKQEDIFLGVLNDLQIASDSLNVNEPGLQGDIIYNGNILEWKKLINSYTLRVLLTLSNHVSDANLNIQHRFNNIVSNPHENPIFTSSNDNFQIQFYNISGNQYPWYRDADMITNYYLDSSFVHMLQVLHDPRLFTYGQPTPNAVAAGLPASDFNAYGGLWGSGPLSYNISKMVAGNASQENARYFNDPINEPEVLFGYPELQFILAEAVEREWITGNAETYYENGIQAAMQFSDYHNTYSPAAIQSYINQPIIQLQPESAIQQIITQKYISMFIQGGWQAFFEYQRTGFPVLEVTGSGVVNQVNGVNAVPRRWMYPLDEYSNNAVNVENTVKSQYPNGDNVNGVMWLWQ